jgi:MFS family permease
MPDRYGRLNTMRFALPFYIISQYLIVFTHSVSTKSLGFFLQGFFHIKITNTYTHILELVPDAHKSKVSTVILGFDSGSVGFVSFLIYYVDINQEHVFKWMFWLGIGATCIYFLIAPESPRFLFMNKK